jgi:hypothetical protein
MAKVCRGKCRKIFFEQKVREKYAQIRVKQITLSETNGFILSFWNRGRGKL